MTGHYEWLLDEMSEANCGPSSMDFRGTDSYSSILEPPAYVAVDNENAGVAGMRGPMDQAQ